ncbi:MAG: indole-3-glycerol phosphate synthase TrpC [Planctomycetota bacterium]|nr:indole-3-glycerol phosphate synthase TrpC [Planctomycetota bacterium]
MPTILDEIVESKKLEIANDQKTISLFDLKEQVHSCAPCANFLDALNSTDDVALIAEVKKASPSKGLIREQFNPISIAKEYEQSGATCISVLTDKKYFQGQLSYLEQISVETSLPLLRKDFVVDPYQIYQARVAGASAVLLIAECLQPAQLNELHDLILLLGMTPLVEFHDANHLDMCLDCGAQLIGVNNRDLNTFKTNLEHVVQLRPQIPADRTVVAESGIFKREDVLKMADAKVQAMLVGESLMRQPNIPQAVRQLLGRT